MKKLFLLIAAVLCTFFFPPANPAGLHVCAGAPSRGGDVIEEAGTDTVNEKSNIEEVSRTDKDSAGQSNTGQSNTGQNGTGKSGTGKISAGQNNTGQSSTGQNSTENSDSGDSRAHRPVSDDDIFYYYYTQISREERLLYDAMLAVAQAPEKGGQAEEARLISLNPSSDAFSASYTRAFNALVTDHPELFWINMARASFKCRYHVFPAFGGKYKVLFTLEYAEGTGFSPEELRAGYAAEQKQLREAADLMLAQVDFTQSDAGIALQLHDLLLDYAWYNRGAGEEDYAHTAYGALVRDSSGSPGGALCDGYSLAYEYLLQRAGITCAMVCGNAGSSETELEKHAWNIVRLDNDWYEVDATWDDLDFDIEPYDEGYDLLMEALSDPVYTARLRHYMFNRTTEQFRSFTPGDEYRYTSESGWVTLLQPSVHIRYTEEDSLESRDYITPLAPQAEGTYYTWEMLTGL